MVGYNDDTIANVQIDFNDGVFCCRCVADSKRSPGSDGFCFHRLHA